MIQKWPKAIIKFIQFHKITGPIRKDGPIDHIVKKVGTPTMGGLLILVGILFGTLLWADLKNPYIWVLLFVSTSFGLLGFVDDFLKIKHNNSTGITSGMKIICQILLSIIAVVLLLNYGNSEHLQNLYFPFFKNLVINLGLFFIPFALFGIDSYLSGVGSSVHIASVNDEAITAQELQDTESQFVAQIRSQNEETDPAIFQDIEFKRAILDQLITSKLVSQEIKNAGFYISDSQIGTYISGMPEFRRNGFWKFPATIGE